MNRSFKISQILVYYDVPEIFVSTDNIGTKHLCLLVEETDNSLEYLSMPISEKRLTQFKVGDIDLKKIFSFPEINEPFIISLYSNDRIEFNKYLDDGIDKNWLPDDGFYLQKAFLNNDEIIGESTAKDNVIVHLALSDKNDDYGINVDDLGDMTKLYSILLENSYKKALKEHKVKNIKQFIIPQNYKLRAFSSSQASFNLHLYSESQKDLFGNCLIELGLEKIDELFSNINNEDELIKTLRSIKGHAVSSFSKMLKKISNDDLKLKHKWFAPNRKNIYSYSIDKDKAEEILSILNKTEELEEEIKEFLGYFVQIDVTRKTWKIRTQEENKIIFGEVKNEEHLKGLTVDSIIYKIVCEEIIEEYKVSEKEKAKYIIKTIEEL